MNDWRLEHPVVALIALGLLLLVVLLRFRRDERLAGFGGEYHRYFDLPALLTYAGVLLLIVALANPQYGVEHTDDTRFGTAILNVIDTSESMEAIDFGVDKEALMRMDGAKQVVAEFIKGRPADLHGLVVFGEVVFTLVPLTADQGLLLQGLDQVQTKIAGRATAIGDALALGVRRLQNAPVDSKIVVLTSDGESNAGEIHPLEAAKYASDQDVKVYTIGIGRGGVAPIQVDTLFGKRIQQVRMPMDEKTLKAIAEETGGRYFNATNIEEMQTVFAEIDKLEKSAFDARVSVSYQDRYPIFLHWGLVCLVLALFWQLLLRPRFPWI